MSKFGLQILSFYPDFIREIKLINKSFIELLFHLFKEKIKAMSNNQLASQQIKGVSPMPKTTARL